MTKIIENYMPLNELIEQIKENLNGENVRCAIIGIVTDIEGDKPDMVNINLGTGKDLMKLLAITERAVFTTLKDGGQVLNEDKN